MCKHTHTHTHSQCFLCFKTLFGLDINGRPFKDTVFHRFLNETYRKTFTLIDAHIKEKFPIFILFLECPESECDITYDPLKSLIKFKNLAGPLTLLRWSVMQSIHGREGLSPEVQLQYYGSVKGYWVSNNQESQDPSSQPAELEMTDSEKEEEKEDAKCSEPCPPAEKKPREYWPSRKSASGPLLHERVEEYLMRPTCSQSGYASDPSEIPTPTTSPSRIANAPHSQTTVVLTQSRPDPEKPSTLSTKAGSETSGSPEHTDDIAPEIVKFTAMPAAAHSITKGDLVGIRVLSQVDCKYIIAATLSGRVYAFDQHAVHERIRLERLEDVTLGKGKDKDSRGLGQKLGSWRWEVSEEDCSRVAKFLPVIISWGFDISIGRTPSEKPLIMCYRVPVVVQTPLGLSDITEFAKVLEASCGAESTVPPAVRRILALRACRTAIKFGTSLTHDECSELMRLLAECRTPFQCAQYT